jgi:mannose-6-phosphate isomerase
MDVKTQLKKPLLLESDNFTPLLRTPWAGRKIYPLYKKHLLHESDQIEDLKIGESWEFSCDPAFPSKLKGMELTIADLVAKYPEQILSPELCARSINPQCEILVKLLDADQPLSLQIHPSDDNADLKNNECGKPESWYVLHAEQGAGIYLGFSEPLTKKELKRAIENGDDVEKKLQFVEARPGDYFEIAPGVPHAIGPGVTLLEPQRILFGQTGKTYRFWDWDRKYDDSGHLDMESGSARELHLEQALKISDPENQVGHEFVQSLRRAPQKVDSEGGCQLFCYPQNDDYQLIIMNFTAETSCSFDIAGGYGCLVALEGEISFAKYDGICCLSGESMLLSHSSLPLCVSSEEFSQIALIIPSVSSFSVDGQLLPEVK